MPDADHNQPEPGHPEPGKQRQRIAAAGLLVAVLCLIMFAFLTWNGAAFFGSLTGEHGVGRLFLLILDTKIDSRVWTAAAGILGVGAAFVAGGGLSNRLFYVIVALSSLSALLCLLFLILLSDAALAHTFYDYGSDRIADSASFNKASTWFLTETAVWLLGIVGMQVGVRAVGGSK